MYIPEVKGQIREVLGTSKLALNAGSLVIYPTVEVTNRCMSLCDVSF
jgi:hypothetical protein